MAPRGVSYAPGASRSQGTILEDAQFKTERPETAAGPPVHTGDAVENLCLSSLPVKWGWCIAE